MDVTNVIACTASCGALWLAWRSERRVKSVEEREKRIALLEPRQKVWRAYSDLMAQFFNKGSVSIELMQKSGAAFQAAIFLFDDEVRVFLEEFLSKVRRHSDIVNTHDSLSNKLFPTFEYEDEFLEMEQINQWLEVHFISGAKLFERHMKIDE